MDRNILLITPPFTQLNTPYPATVFLKGFLNSKSIPSCQVDLGIELILSIFSKKGLCLLFDHIEAEQARLSENSQRMLALRNEYIETIDEVIRFLQNKNENLALLICNGNFLPKAARFNNEVDLEWSFGEMGTRDKAKFLATLYLEDISDLIQDAVDPHFGFSRYAERIGRSAATFNEIERKINAPNGFIDKMLIELLYKKTELKKPAIVAISIPFPGNLYSALKCGQWLKKHHPEIKIVLGGGFVNTELRELKDPRIFNYVDYICLDDGELPLACLLEHLDGKRETSHLKRTFCLKKGQVTYFNNAPEKDYLQKELGTPDYDGLELDKYLSVIEIANPMQSLWTNGRWNKLTLAHGCYWAKCNFCDTSLDYIQRYDPNPASLICDRMEAIIKQTGQIGFHFVDEAAPPALLKKLALEILKRRITAVWWTNIRFEKNFTQDLCTLLKQSGCIAVSGGLEVASDRLLKLINKGVCIAQVAKAARNFTQAGIMVHTYLMYGFPTQTAQETINSLEMVRQMFETGIVQSGFWHQFAMTAHSPVGKNPAQFKVERETNCSNPFANNDLVFTDKYGTEHEAFSKGLWQATYNFMHGVGFDLVANDWFDFETPPVTISPNFIEQVISTPEETGIDPRKQIVWTGNAPQINFFTKKKKGKTKEMAELVFRNKNTTMRLNVEQNLGKWLAYILPQLSITKDEKYTCQTLKQSFEKATLSNFNLFWNSYALKKLRENGLLTL